ncbi:MAG: ATP-binding protein [Bacteroidota bacterium]|nr:ATP-binding protein [Bacteroidota bacterium]
MSENKPIRLLIVEDDEDDFFLLEMSLKEISFEKNITWAASYDKAISTVDSESFDIILVDYRLGVHTGIELISHINQHSPYTPTILLTGVKETTIDQEALKYGAYDYLVKDQYSVESLSRSIRYAIEKAKVLKSLKESENKFKNLFENAVEYVFLIDSNHRIIDANKAALKFFEEEKKAEIIGINISDYISPKILDPKQFLNSSVEVEFFIREENKKCFCIMNLSVVDAEQNLFQLVLHDITERRNNEQKEKLLEKQVLTGKVARIIAHEIKNPLTNIHLSLLELRTMLEGAQLVDNREKPSDFIDIIERNGKRINTLIEDLLNATRFDTINLKETKMEEVLNETLALVQDRAKLKNVQIEKSVQAKLLLKGDKEKLVIALLNILVNAVEAVDEKVGKLKIMMSSANKVIHLAISDNGKGIPSQDLNKLFEPFFTSKKGGTGLGLTATYNIITKHDGTIRVVSEVGEGTTFLITLPEYR